MSVAIIDNEQNTQNYNNDKVEPKGEGKWRGKGRERGKGGERGKELSRLDPKHQKNWTTESKETAKDIKWSIVRIAALLCAS